MCCCLIERQVNNPGCQLESRYKILLYGCLFSIIINSCIHRLLLNYDRYWNIKAYIVTTGWINTKNGREILACDLELREELTNTLSESDLEQSYIHRDYLFCFVCVLIFKYIYCKKLSTYFHSSIELSMWCRLAMKQNIINKTLTCCPVCFVFVSNANANRTNWSLIVDLYTHKTRMRIERNETFAYATDQ